MSSVDDFPPTGYQDDDNDRVVPTGTSEQTTVVKKKGSKLPLIIFAVFMIVAIGVVGMMFLGGKKAPPKAPAPQETTTPADPAVDPTADPTLDPNAAPADPNVDPNADPFAAQNGEAPADPFAAPQIDPATGLPMVQPAQQPQIDPTTGLPVVQQQLDPATGLPLAQPAQQPGLQQPVTPQIDPSTGLPLAQPAQQPIQQQPMVSQQIDPATGLPMVQPVQPQVPVNPADPFASMGQPAPQPVVQQPAVQQPAVQQPITQPQFPVEPVQQPAVQPDTYEQPADQSSIAIDPLAQFRTLLAPIDSRVTSLEKKFSGLEKSVKRLQAWVSNNDDKPAVRSAPARQAPRVNHEPSIRVAPPVSRVIIEDGRVSHVERPRSELRWERQAPAQVAHVPAESCDIQAIVQGRVWVKRQDGSFVSYGEGDAWQNGAMISGIDPQRGINVDGRWICM